MGRQEELEARAEERFAEFIELKEKGENPDLDALLEQDPDVAPFLKQLLDMHEVLFPSLKHQQVGEYELLRLIGEGGMGIVYEADQPALNRHVAIKFLPRIDLTLDPQSLDRFKREMAYLAKLDHPYIVPVFDAGQVEGRPYFVMPLLKGKNLAEILKERKDRDAGGLGEKQAVQWMIQIASSLEYIHAQGIIHRDIKPSNIFITRDGQDARLLDFGLARSMDATALTRTGQSSGTPAYMSPEQVAGKTDIGPPTDLYLFGSTFYEALTLRRPFDQEDRDLLRQSILKDPPPRPSRFSKGISRDLESILLCCLHKNPEKRFPSACELHEDLIRLQEGEPIMIRPPSLLDRQGRIAGKIVRKHPFLPMLLVFLAVLLFTMPFLSVLNPFSIGRIDESPFNIICSSDQTGSHISAIKSATDEPLFTSLTNENIIRSMSDNLPLIRFAELDPSNHSLEVVWNKRQLDFRAHSYDKNGSEMLLWRVESKNPRQELAQWEDFKTCQIRPIPDLLEMNLDAILIVLGKQKENGGNYETAILVLNSKGEIVSTYHTQGIQGWTVESLKPCDIGPCFPGDHGPEILIAGYKTAMIDYPHPVITLLKPFPDDGHETKHGLKNMKALEYVLPVTTNNPGLDSDLQNSYINWISRPNIRNPMGMFFVIHSRLGILEYIFLNSGIYYYYLEYNNDNNRLDWIRVDYNDVIRNYFDKNGLTYKDLPYDGSTFESMKNKAECKDELWFSF